MKWKLFTAVILALAVAVAVVWSCRSSGIDPKVRVALANVKDEFGYTDAQLVDFLKVSKFREWAQVNAFMEEGLSPEQIARAAKNTDEIVAAIQSDDRMSAIVAYHALKALAEGDEARVKKQLIGAIERFARRVKRQGELSDIPEIRAFQETDLSFLAEIEELAQKDSDLAKALAEIP